MGKGHIKAVRKEELEMTNTCMKTLHMEKCKPNSSEIPLEPITIAKGVKRKQFHLSLLGVWICVVFLCNWSISVKSFRNAFSFD